MFHLCSYENEHVDVDYSCAGGLDFRPDVPRRPGRRFRVGARDLACIGQERCFILLDAIQNPGNPGDRLPKVRISEPCVDDGACGRGVVVVRRVCDPGDDCGQVSSRLPLAVGVGVGSGVGVAVAIAARLGVGVAVGDAISDAVAIGVRVGVGVAVVVRAGVGVGAGVGFTVGAGGQGEERQGEEGDRSQEALLHPG